MNCMSLGKKCVNNLKDTKQTQCHTGIDSVPLFPPPRTLKNIQVKVYLGPTQTLFHSPLVSTISAHLYSTAVIGWHGPHQTTVDWPLPHIPGAFLSSNVVSLPTPQSWKVLKGQLKTTMLIPQNC